MKTNLTSKVSILFLLTGLLSSIHTSAAYAATAGTGNCTQTYTISSGAGTVAVTEFNGYCYIAFKNSGALNTQTSFSWTKPAGVTNLSDVLIVAGGGGGGAHVGGGGGAGGLLQLSNQNVSSLSSINLAVGAGGQGAFTDIGGDVNQGAGVTSWSIAGENSSFNGTSATGGGRGAFWWNESPVLARNGLAGGGGSGGGAVNQISANTSGASGINGQGFAGGNGGTGVPGANSYQTGGGGGASAVGATASDAAGSYKSGNGGAGTEVAWLNSVSQTLIVGHWVSAQSKTYFAGGGGGGFHNADLSNPFGSGGVGGGGKGVGPTVNNQKVFGESGTATTGGGGGGSGAPSSGSHQSTGGAGGSGVVVLRYVIPDTTAPTFTSSTSFSAAENIATSANAATIQVSESATVTISSGVDAALFNIVTSDTVTVFIRFKTSPNFESPSDNGGNNVYDLVLTATDLASNAGTQTITITVTDVVDTSSFNSFSLSGTPTFRTVVTITANVSVASRVSFRAKNVIIAGCKNKVASGSGSSFSATCSWRPSTRGAVTLTATASPTGAGISSTSATPISVMVGNRTGAR